MLQKPPPELKVVREKYCSQEMTDKSIAYLFQQAPEQLTDWIEALNNKPYAWGMKHQLAIRNWFLKEAARNKFIPQTRLGRMDLVFELTRRFHEFYKLTEDERLYFWPLKKSRVEGPNDPLPPVPPIHMQPRRPGYDYPITLEMVQKTFDALCSEAPELIYEVSEACRLGFDLGGGEEYFAMIDFISRFVSTNKLAPEKDIPMRVAPAIMLVIYGNISFMWVM